MADDTSKPPPSLRGEVRESAPSSQMCHLGGVSLSSACRQPVVVSAWRTTGEVRERESESEERGPTERRGRREVNVRRGGNSEADPTQGKATARPTGG